MACFPLIIPVCLSLSPDRVAPVAMIIRGRCVVTLPFGSVVFSTSSPLSYFLRCSTYVQTSAIARCRHRQRQHPATPRPQSHSPFSSIREHGLGSSFSFNPSSFKLTRRVTTYVILKHGRIPTYLTVAARRLLT